MQLDFTKEQEELFLKLVYMGQEVMAASNFVNTEKMEEVIQMIYKKAYESGYQKFFEFDEDDENYIYPSMVFDDDKEITSFLEEYEDEIMSYYISDEAYKLAKRDIKNQNPLLNISDEEFENKFREQIDNLQEKYFGELVDNGLINFKLNK